MKGMIKALTVAALGVALTATSAFAQAGLMIGGGLTMPQGDFKNGTKSGYHAMAALDFGVLGAPLGIRVTGAYHLNDYDLAGNPDAAANIRSVEGDLVYSFPSPGVRPYFLGGVTWGSLRCNGNDCASDAATSATGFNAGGGIRLGGIFAEARYVSLGGDLDIKYVPITVGFHF